VSAERRQAPEGGWGELTVDELKSELEARDLPKSGKKDELIARLDEDDASAGAAPAAAPVEEATAEATTETPAEAADAATAKAPEEAAEEAPEEAVEETPEVAAEETPEVAAEETPEAEVPEPDSDEAQEAGEDAAAAADADEEAAEEAGEEPEGKQPRRRRGSAETYTGAQRRTRAPRREGDLIVRARTKYVRSTPRKARLVMDHIRGKRVEQAQAILAHAPRAVSSDILKLLNSAVANAEDAYELGADELTVRRAYVDEGPTIKRYRPRALGRATRINKRTSHMTIELTAEGNGR
jgi:large subunit ribosomal protein L22